jgi:anti-anti-sigma factor
VEDVTGPQSPFLDCDVRDEDGSVVFALVGEMDLSNLGVVRSRLEDAVKDRPVRLVLDLSKLEFIDSSGIALLLETSNRAVHIEVRPSYAVRRLIELMGLHDALPIVE